MKAASPALIALLNSGDDFLYADIWTITLSGGAVIRWSGVDKEMKVDGQTFALAPLIERSAITEKIGLEVATLMVKLDAGDDDLINGTPIIPFVARRGLDGANVRLDRAFLTDWALPVVGSVLRFSGRVTSIGDIAGSSASITVSSWTILLNVNMPTNLFQTACLHTVYDPGCGIDPVAFQVTGNLTGTPTALAFGTTATITANDFAQGRILFTSGFNSGLSATVRSNDGAGGFVLIRDLPRAPSAGDSFIAYPGCDLTRGRCLTKFNNLVKLKATPFVPVPETVFG